VKDDFAQEIQPFAQEIQFATWYSRNPYQGIHSWLVFIVSW